MNILILNWRDIKHPRSGGAEIVTFEHAKRWVLKGHKVTWFTSWFEHALPDEWIDGVQIVRRGGSLSIYLVAPWYCMLHAKEFDIIVDEVHGIPFFTPLYSRIKSVAFIHEIAKEIWDYMGFFPLNILGKILEPMYLIIYKNMQFWTDSQSTIHELVDKGIPVENCIAIPCPVSNPIVKTIPKKEHNPTFLYLSRLIKMKGIEDVIHAFKLIHYRLPDAILWVAGEGQPEYVAKLKSQVSDIGLGYNVIFFDKVSQRKKLALMGKAHIFMHASIREGWGLVVLEAASQGTPSVVYGVPGLRDVVMHNQTGIVTSINTPAVLADEVVSLYYDTKKYRTLQRGALQFVKSLQWNLVATQSLNLLERIYKGKQ